MTNYMVSKECLEVEMALRENKRERIKQNKTKWFLWDLGLKGPSKDPGYTFPYGKVTGTVNTRIVSDIPVFFWNEGGSKGIILYIHGGAYSSHPCENQICRIDQIARESNCTVALPVYPIAPWSTFQKAYEGIEALYMEIVEQHGSENIVVIGDSAGAGLALGFDMVLRDKGIPLPREMIIISPWLDIMLENPEIADYERTDCDLYPKDLRRYGLLWAGSEEMTKDFRVSPIYGDPEGLSNVTIFIGTKDLFLPDNMKFHRMMEEKGVEHGFIIDEGMVHDYPFHDTPEGEDACRRIVGIIDGKR